MTPIAALPWFYAASIEGLLIGMALAIVIDTSVRLAYRVSGVAPRGSGLAVKQALLLTILVAAHRDIYLENINLMLAAAVVTALRYSDRPALAGPLLGLVLALKPYFALLLGVLFLTGNFVTVMVGGLSVALYNLLPLVFLPLPRVLDLSRGWLAAMGEHVGAATFTAFPNLLARLVPSAFGLDFRMALLLSALAATAAICCSYLALRSSSRPPAAKTEASRVLALITLALLPSLVPVDDQQFLFAAPLIAYVYVRARSVPDARARRTWTLAATGIALLFAGNMPDLIGPWLSSQWTKYGLLGLANLGFIACAACLWRQSSVAVDDAVDRHVAWLVVARIRAVDPVQNAAIRRSGIALRRFGRRDVVAAGFDDHTQLQIGQVTEILAVDDFDGDLRRRADLDTEVVVPSLILEQVDDRAADVCPGEKAIGRRVFPISDLAVDDADRTAATHTFRKITAQVGDCRVLRLGNRQGHNGTEESTRRERQHR